MTSPKVAGITTILRVIISTKHWFSSKHFKENALVPNSQPKGFPTFYMPLTISSLSKVFRLFSLNPNKSIIFTSLSAQTINRSCRSIG